MAGKVGSSRQGRAQFPMERELEFAEYLVELKRANRINKGNLKSEVFPAIVDKFAKKGCHFDISQIKAKYYALRAQTQEYNRMRMRVTGAGWDPLLQTVTMDEIKWQDVIKVFHLIFSFLSHKLIKYKKNFRYILCVNFGFKCVGESIF